MSPDDGIDAERALLSCCMQRKEAIYEVLDIVQFDDFAQPKHEAIFRALLSLANTNSPTDVIAVTHELERIDYLNQVGGAAYLHTLTDYATSSYSATFYADIVHEDGRRRALAVAAEVVRNLAEDRSLDKDTMIEAAVNAVRDASSLKRADDADSLLVADEVVASIGKAEPAFETPWRDLNGMIRGFRRGGLYIVGARPAVGKSVVALQMASALGHFGHVAFFTMEMSKEEVVKRLIAQEADVTHSMIDGPNELPPWALAKVNEWRATHPGRILFDDRGSLTIGQMRAQLRRWSREYDMTGCVVDYLQLMNGDPRQTKVAQVTEISRQLKVMAREFDIPIIALSQLNRNPEQRVDRKPALGDLRESGSIEQDADVVVLLHRDVTDPTSDLDMIVAKNRQGPTGSLSLTWQGDFMRAVA